MTGESHLCHCSKCGRCKQVESFNENDSCDDCGELVDHLQVCSTRECQEWYTVNHPGGTCVRCGSQLGPGTMEQQSQLVNNIESRGGGVASVPDEAAAGLPAVEPRPLEEQAQQSGGHDWRDANRRVMADGTMAVWKPRTGKGEPYWPADVKLGKNESFVDYVKRMDQDQPYGVDRFGKAYTFPVIHDQEIAFRFDMESRSDWGGLRRTGLGWRLNPSLFIGLVFFLPPMLLPAIFMLVHGHAEHFIDQLVMDTMVIAPLILLLAVLVKLVGYCQLGIEEMLKPYGREANAIKMLFIDDLEYLKWARKTINEIYDMKFLKIGLVVFLAWLLIDLPPYFTSTDAYHNLLIVPLPAWTMFNKIIGSIGMGMLIFLMVAFLGAVIYGLFKIGKLADDKELLSISNYANMISLINVKYSEAQASKANIKDMIEDSDIDISGKTYFEFQRGNRKIGEFLFNIASLLIIISVGAAVILFLIWSLDLLPVYEGGLMVWTSGLFVVGMLALAIFIAPQLNLHKFLKEFKYGLIDSFSVLLSRLEYFYFEATLRPDVLQVIDETWQSRKDLLEDVNFIKETIAEVRKYGTWSYDFPEVMKLVLVGAATLIPLVLSMIGGGA